MKFLAVATLFFAAGLAAPTEVYPPPPPPPTYSLPANGGGSPPHGTVPPPTGNKPPGGNSPPQSGNGNDNKFVASCPPGLFSDPQCCATDVLGVADLDCKPPNKLPHDAADFKSICAKGGAEPKCCVLPVAGQALLCQTPVGI